jgi:CheY-like chemotaxis protein
MEMELKRVLVVDDDTAIRETLRLILEDAGYDVIEASTGSQALGLLRSSPNSLVVLLDLIMPDGDGGAVLRAVAADSVLSRRHGYAVMTAGSERAIESLAPMLAPMHSVTMRKPFDIDQVLEVVGALRRDLGVRD